MKMRLQVARRSGNDVTASGLHLAAFCLAKDSENGNRCLDENFPVETEADYPTLLQSWNLFTRKPPNPEPQPGWACLPQ